MARNRLASVDLGAPPALASYVAVSFGGPTVLPFAGVVAGELLCLPPYAVDAAFGAHAIAVPDDCHLLGVTVTLQGARFTLGGSFELVNALDGTFGSS